jgi:predicted RNA polymerase sigma factor
MTAAKRRALDRMRREKMADRSAGTADGATDVEGPLDDDIGDDLLRLIFTACHPVLPSEARVALSPRLHSASCAPSVRSPKDSF